MAKLICPVASRCGGCQMTSLTYAETLAKKQAYMEELLAPFCQVEPIRGMKRPFRYRNKVHAVLAADKRGNPVSGVYEAGTHHVVPVRSCQIEDARADAVIQDIVTLLPSFKYRVYNEYTHRGFLRHIVIRTAQNRPGMLVTLVATSLEMPRKHDFVKALLTQHPEISSIVLNCNDRRTSAVLGKKECVLYGDGYLEDSLCGCTFRISSQSFYQVNAQQAEVLYTLAVGAAQLTGRETLLDAYCGTGTIGLCAAKGVKKLIGVELNADAVRDAKENAKRNRVQNATFLCDDAGRFMERMAAQGTSTDVVIMDPPRAGSDERFLQSLLKMAPKRVVYVSCGPESLARDLATLTAGGYKAEKAMPVDMFPWTEHVETVVVLRRES